MAMAAGLPVVASDIPANRKMITHKENGLLVRSDNPNEIGRTISEIAAHPEPARRIAREGAALVRSKHNMDSWIKQYERLFISLLAGPGLS